MNTGAGQPTPDSLIVKHPQSVLMSTDGPVKQTIVWIRVFMEVSTL